MFSAICYKQVKRLYLLMQKSKKILSFSFLIIFGLFFAHSELSLFAETSNLDYCGEKHKGHDYCEIIKGARIEKPNIQNKITPPIIQFIHNDCCDGCKDIKDYLQNALFTSTKKLFSPPTFLINRTLLI